MYQEFISKILSLFSPVEEIIEVLNKLSNNSDQELLSALKKSSVIHNKILENKLVHGKRIETEEVRSELSALEVFISPFPVQTVLYQDLERFQPDKSDVFKIKVLKKLKNFVLKLKWIPTKCLNFFRRLAKRPPLELKTWKQRIPEQKLAKHVFRNIFLKRFTQKLSEWLLIREQLFHALKNIDQEISSAILLKGKLENCEIESKIADISNQYKTLCKDIESFFCGIENELEKEFASHKKIVDTIEFPLKKVSDKNQEKLYQSYLQKFSSLFDKYNTRFYAIHEHWVLIHETHFFALSAIDSFIATEDAIQNTFNEKYYSNDNKTVEILGDAVEKLSNGNPLDLSGKSLLSEDLIQKQIPDYLDTIIKTEISSEINVLKDQLTQAFFNIRQNFDLPLKTKFEHVTSPKHLRTLDLKEIVNGWAIELINSPLNKEIELLTEHQKGTIAYLNELSGIVEYACEYFHSKENIDIEQQTKEFRHGIERAHKRSIENQSSNLFFGNSIVNNLQNVKNSLIEEVIGSITPDKLREKHTIMVRKRAINTLKEKSANFVNQGKKFAYAGYIKAVSLIREIRSQYSSYRDVLGLTASSESINAELSNYLSETELAISKLPRMYQKLFSIAPVENPKFRIPRPFARKQLEIAYSNWTTGKFAPTCVVGETGSGLTSLVNEFIEKFGHQYQVHRTNPGKKVKSQTDLLHLLKETFTDLEFDTIPELREKLLLVKRRKIVIIENIHRLFIRKMGGFKNLVFLFELISQTNSKVFWLNTCLYYTYKYLDYSIGINNYYAHVAILDKLTKDHIADTILNRHKFSGYKLNFIAPENYFAKRNFKKLSSSEKQQILQEDYFKRLFNYAQNNLSLALIFWMRSIQNIEDNTFNLQFKNLNFSFVNSLKSSQIASLYAIILHGWLNIEDHMEIFNLSKADSFRQLMVFVDDGILIKKQDNYYINPLVYRQVVNHLTSLNYIH